MTPGGLLVRNRDDLFPAFHGQDLSSRRPARLAHRAQDGATVADLSRQAQGLPAQGEGDALALLTIGGNDLLSGLVVDEGPGVDAFAAALDAFLRRLPVRPVFVGNVYDPAFGDDARRFLPVDTAVAWTNHRRLSDVLAEATTRHGALVDLHAHFLAAIRRGSRRSSSRA